LRSGWGNDDELRKRTLAELYEFNLCLYGLYSDMTKKTDERGLTDLVRNNVKNFCGIKQQNNTKGKNIVRSAKSANIFLFLK
jgi:hypothetical protein